MTYWTPKQTSIVQDDILDTSLTGTTTTPNVPSAPIIAADLQETETTDTPEKSLPNGRDVPKIDNYDRIGNFNLNDLRVETLDTGFNILNKHLILAKGLPQLVTVAAYTSHGKTALMMQIAANVAKYGPVFVHSFEMSKRQLETRLIAAIAEVPAEQVMAGKCPQSKLTKATKEFADRELYLSKSSDSSINYVMTSCFEKAKILGPPALIVIDYLQLMVSKVPNASRTREIAECMRGLKTLAEQLKCPILLGSQMNRKCEERGQEIEVRKGVGEYKPMIGDIAESSNIAHDSDVVLFVTRQEQYDGTRPNQADFLCAKNRNGQTFEATLQWTGALCSFREQATSTGGF